VLHKDSTEKGKTVTEARIARPPLATVISIYEIVLFAFAAFGFVIAFVLHASHSAFTVNAPMLQTAGSALSALFSLAGGVYLWLMRQAAYRMLAGKVVVDFILFILTLLQPSAPPITRIMAMAINLLLIVLNAAIAWYAYKVTSPAAAQGSSTEVSA
jgi:hypothetical protein